MPYIKKEQRPYLDEAVELVVERLVLKPHHKNVGLTTGQMAGDVNPGELNYIISSIIWKLWNKKMSYAQGSMLCGVLNDVEHEFRRRKFDGYEDEKIKENGDI
jgi:hypothetical protein